MRIVSHKLARENREIIIVPIGDAHDGDQFADEQYVDNRIQYVLEKDNAYCVLCGDIANVATRNGKSDVYGARYSIEEQFDRQIERFKALAEAKKILAITEGNHEGRTYTESGLSYTHAFVKTLKLESLYGAEGVYLIMRVGIYKPIFYTIYMTHGKKSGRKEGSKVQAAVDLGSIISADLYIHAHSHLGAIIPGIHKTVDIEKECIVENEVIYINLAAALNYGGYGEVGEYKPLSKRSPVIYLCGTKKAMDADFGDRGRWE